MWITARLLCRNIAICRTLHVCNQFSTSNTQTAFESFSVAMVTLLLYLVLSVIHLAVKKMNKREESRCSKFTLQPAVRKTRFYLFISHFSAHKRDLLEAFGEKKYEEYIQSVFSVINKVTEAEKPAMSCHRIWTSICFLLTCIQAENHHGKPKLGSKTWLWLLGLVWFEFTR